MIVFGESPHVHEAFRQNMLSSWWWLFCVYLSFFDIWSSSIEAFIPLLGNGNGRYPFQHVHFIMSCSLLFQALTPLSNEVSVQCIGFSFIKSIPWFLYQTVHSFMRHISLYQVFTSAFNGSSFVKDILSFDFYIRCSLLPIFKSRLLSHCYKDPHDPQLLGVRGGAGWIRARPPFGTFGIEFAAGADTSSLLLQTLLQLLVFFRREIPRRPRLCKWRSPENPSENAEKEGQQ